MKILKVNPQNPEPEAIETAAEAIRSGELVIFPTETVYGLACDAINESAIERVFDAKGRDKKHPLPVQIASVTDLSRVASRIPEIAFKLAERFWPGPLTLVLPKSEHISFKITGSTETIGIRIPDHPVALAILNRVRIPIIATSANITGQNPPITAQEAIASIGEKVAVVLDAGECKIRVPSTVLDVSVTPPHILRVGAISVDEIRDIIPDCQIS
ncbi:MAG: L-threonylcarbamoyladenylate synthase [Armatimonadota bacterium]